MFQVLKDTNLKIVDEALYHMGLRIHERRYFPEWRHWLPLRTSGVLRPESIEVATAVLEEIEARAGKPLCAIDDDEMRRYTRMIDGISDERRSRELNLDPERGERLLEELRREYADVGRRVA